MQECFAEYDRKTKWMHVEDWKKAAKKHGYQYISEFLASEYSRGRSINEIARMAKLSREPIQRRLHELERLGFVKVRSRGGANRKAKWPTPEIDTRIVELREKGLTFRQIGERLGFEDYRIRGRYNRLKLKTGRDRRNAEGHLYSE